MTLSVLKMRDMLSKKAKNKEIQCILLKESALFSARLIGMKQECKWILSLLGFYYIQYTIVNFLCNTNLYIHTLY